MNDINNNLPPQLLKALEQNRCVLFLGAGVSANAGLPSGKELSHLLADELCEDFSRDQNRTGGIPELQDRRDNLPWVAQLHNDYYSGRGAQHKIAELLSDRERSAHIEILRPLRELVPIREIITTNYDTLVETVLGPTDYQIIYRASDIRLTDSPKVDLIKLHGTRTDIDSMILTKDDYDKFQQKHQALIELVKTILRK